MCLALALLSSSSNEEAPTDVRLHFERGVADVLLVWSENDLEFFRRVPAQRAVTFVPTGKGELVGYDFLSGETRRIRLVHRSLVIGGVRATRQ